MKAKLCAWAKVVRVEGAGFGRRWGDGTRVVHSVLCQMHLGM